VFSLNSSSEIRRRLFPRRFPRASVSLRKRIIRQKSQIGIISSVIRIIALIARFNLDSADRF